MPCQVNDTGCGNKTFQETKDYLKAPGIYLIRNQKRFDSRDFGKNVIVEESAAFWASFNKEHANLAEGTIRLQSLVDQIDFLQVGQEDHYNLWELELG
jgi:hypothetical protein